MPDLVFKISVKDDGSSVVQRFGENVRAEVDKIHKKQHEDKKGFFEGINEKFGRRSELGHMTHMLEGGGAVMGLSMAGHALSEASGKAVELQKSLAEGKISSGEMAAELAKGLPVFGGYITALGNIYELMTGEAAAAEQIKHYQEYAAEAVRQHQELLVKEVHEYQNLEKAIRGAVQARELLNVEGPQKSVVSATHKRENLEKDRDSELERAASEVKEKHRAGIEKAQEEATKATEAVTAAKNATDHKWSHGSADMIGRAIDNQNERALHAAEATLQPYLRLLADRVREQDRAVQKNQFGTTVKYLKDLKLAMAEEEKAKDEEREAREQWSADEAKQVQKDGEHIADVEHETRQAALRAQGSDLEAELDQLRHAAEEKKRLIDEASQENLKKLQKDLTSGIINPYQFSKSLLAQTGRAESEKAAVDKGLDQKVADAHREDDLKKKKEAFSEEEAFRRQKIQQIEDEIAANNHLHEAEKARLQLEEQFAARRRAFQEVIDNPRSSFAASDAARKGLEALPGQEAEAKAAKAKQLNDDLREKIMGDQAASGNVPAKIALAKLEVEKKFKAEREQLQGQVRPGMKHSEWRVKQGQMDALNAAEQAAMLKASNPFAATPQIASREDGRGHLSGAAGRARENAFLDKPELKIKIPPVLEAGAKAQAKTATATELIAKTLTTFLSTLGLGGGGGDELPVFNNRT